MPGHQNSRGRGRGRGGRRPHPYQGSRRPNHHTGQQQQQPTQGPSRTRFEVLEPNTDNYARNLPEHESKGRMIVTKAKTLKCRQGLELANNNFTWQPSKPSTPGFPEESSLQESLEEARVLYRERCKSLIINHLQGLLNHNSELLTELERENPPIQPNNPIPAPSQETIMARMAEMVEGLESRVRLLIPATIQQVLAQQMAPAEDEEVD